MHLEKVIAEYFPQATPGYPDWLELDSTLTGRGCLLATTGALAHGAWSELAIDSPQGGFGG